MKNRKLKIVLLVSAILLVFTVAICIGEEFKDKKVFHQFYKNMQKVEWEGLQLSMKGLPSINNQKADDLSNIVNDESESNSSGQDSKQSVESTYTIVIDAGHQAKQNKEQEPIGPNATETKPKVSSGTQGRFTGVPEYEVNLKVALLVQELLQEKGYQVIMVRETNEVNISNSERAKVANDNNADVFIRIHCNGSDSKTTKGILTMCQTKNNPYCADTYEQCRRLSDCILTSLCEVTGANNQGVIETDTMSGINWCKVPVTIIGMGYMTNKEEDELLVSSSYQQKLAMGIVGGIEEYLE